MSGLSAEGVRQAASRISGRVHSTPVLTSRTLDKLIGGKLYLKAENFQRGGSFKVRGAFNKILSLNEADAEKGVVASSSGNHAQAVAIAAREAGVGATIVMPTDAVTSKLQATLSYGAHVVPCDREVEDLEARAIRLAHESGALLVHPFDDPLVITGQGTAALELLEQVGPLDCIVVPIGGGGLCAGSALIATALEPGIELFGVEPLGADDAKRSIVTGTRVRLDRPHSIADGQLVPQLGELAFMVLQKTLTDVLLVGDREISDSMALAFDRLKIVLEPSGATGLSAVVRYSAKFAEKRVGVILSGGNVDHDRFAMLTSAKS